MIYKYTDDETKLEMIDMFSYTNQECKLENKGVRKCTKMTFPETFDHLLYKLIQKFYEHIVVLVNIWFRRLHYYL